MDPLSFAAAVPGGPGAAAQARRLVWSQLGGHVPTHLLGDVALLVTELVANGVRHGGAGPDDVLELRFEVRPPRLRVEVADPGQRGEGGVGPRAADYRRGGGLGLQIVDQVAERWGTGDGPHTCVWFEMDVTRADS